MRSYSLVDAILEVDRELNDSRCKHKHLLGGGKPLPREHEEGVRVYGQRQRISQVHVLEPVIGGLQPVISCLPVVSLVARHLANNIWPKFEASQTNASRADSS